MIIHNASEVKARFETLTGAPKQYNWGQTPIVLFCSHFALAGKHAMEEIGRIIQRLAEDTVNG